MKLIDTYVVKQRVPTAKVVDANNFDVDKFFREHVKLIDVEYQLYKSEDTKLFSEISYWLYYQCPSTGREYMSGIDPKIAVKGAKESIAWKSGMTSQEFEKIQIHS